MQRTQPCTHAHTKHEKTPHSRLHEHTAPHGKRTLPSAFIVLLRSPVDRSHTMALLPPSPVISVDQSPLSCMQDTCETTPTRTALAVRTITTHTHAQAHAGMLSAARTHPYGVHRGPADSVPSRTTHTRAPATAAQTHLPPHQIHTAASRHRLNATPRATSHPAQQARKQRTTMQP